jgi:O-acetylhomoserine/O-acetylserine sulfhydrylase
VTFKHYGIGVKWVTEDTPEAFAAAIDEKTKAIYVESIANPKYRVSDIPALAKVFDMHGFASPTLANLR